MKILIDADGCPVVNITIAIAKEHNLKCILICDTSHFFERDGAETITVDKGADSADFKLVNMTEKGDIVITQDYGLAAMCLSKGAIPISQNGLIYNDFNIGSLLESRHKAKEIRMSGKRLKGPQKRTSEQDTEFKKVLLKIIS